VSDAAELRAYLAGWDDAIECFLETLSWVPDEQLPSVIRESARRHTPIEGDGSGRHCFDIELDTIVHPTQEKLI